MDLSTIKLILSIIMIVVGGLIVWKGNGIINLIIKIQEIVLGAIGAIIGGLIGSTIGVLAGGGFGALVGAIIFGLIGYSIGALSFSGILFLIYIGVVITLSATMHWIIAIFVAFIIYFITLCLIYAFFRAFGLLLFIVGLYLFGGITAVFLGIFVIGLLLYAFVKDIWKDMFTETSDEWGKTTKGEISKEEYEIRQNKIMSDQTKLDEQLIEGIITEEEYNKKRVQLKNSKSLKVEKITTNINIKGKITLKEKEQMKRVILTLAMIVFGLFAFVLSLLSYLPRHLHLGGIGSLIPLIVFEIITIVLVTKQPKQDRGKWSILFIIIVGVIIMIRLIPWMIYTLAIWSIR